MKKLILASEDIMSRQVKEEFFKLIEKDLPGTKVLILLTERKKLSSEKIKDQFVSLDIKEENITCVNISEEILAENFNGFDIIYVYGGNTYTILDRIRRAGFDKLIQNHVGSGGLYIGNSAGSIIAGPQIEITKFWDDTDPNKVGIKDLAGLNLTNISVFPHANQKPNVNLDEFRKQVNYPVMSVKDGEAIIIKGEEVVKV
jgi:dipeptidase E